jgi:hypothetical protein
MKYNLWDIETSNYFGQFENEHEVLKLVRTLVDYYGEQYASDLGLGRVTDQGEILEPLMGDALITRVNEVFPEREGADQGRGAAIAS